jgi:two-component system uhpT operon response regulator UhpA
MIKLIIADDHNRVREAWVFILSRNPDIDIIAQCRNGEEAVQAVKKHCPDVLLAGYQYGAHERDSSCSNHF